MKTSIIFQAGVRVLCPLLVVFSLLIMWRGHQLPGGGFIGGLVAACALVLRDLAAGAPASQRQSARRFESRYFIILGLSLAAASTLVSPLVEGTAFMKGYWLYLPVIGKFGTPVVFDIGVYFVVIGVVGSILLPLLRREHA